MKKLALQARRHNARQITKDPVAVFSGILAFSVIMYVGYYFDDMGATIGNLGKSFFYTQMIVHILLAIIFWIFIAATVYKIRYFDAIGPSTTTAAGSAGGFIGAIIIGCPACSISIASYLGIGTLLTHLPGFWLEIKILGLLVLVRATYKTINELYTCNLSHNKKSLP